MYHSYAHLSINHFLFPHARPSLFFIDSTATATTLRSLLWKLAYVHEERTSIPNSKSIIAFSPGSDEVAVLRNWLQLRKTISRKPKRPSRKILKQSFSTKIEAELTFALKLQPLRFLATKTRNIILMDSTRQWRRFNELPPSFTRIYENFKKIQHKHEGERWKAKKWKHRTTLLHLIYLWRVISHSSRPLKNPRKW